MQLKGNIIVIYVKVNLTVDPLQLLNISSLLIGLVILTIPTDYLAKEKPQSDKIPIIQRTTNARYEVNT